MAKPRILFMGTPEFAVPSLEALIAHDCSIVGVVTQPDKPKGRGRKTASSAVKECAEKHALPVYQPQRVRDADFLSTFDALAPDMVVLVAFGQILPREIIDGPPLGCINVHPSLLPSYRGAAPINWAIINGDTKTGVTIMYMSEEVDAGDMILQREVPIESDDTYDDLSRRLSTLGATCLVDSIDDVQMGTANRTAQNHSRATFAPRITPETGHINWNDSVVNIVNLIRGLSSIPGAYSFLRARKFKVFSAAAVQKKTSGEKAPGTIGQFMESGLQITAGDGHVYLQDVQLEGKRRMAIDDFLRGFPLTDDDILD